MVLITPFFQRTPSQKDKLRNKALFLFLLLPVSSLAYTSLSDQVLKSDITLVPPSSSGPTIAAITAFNWRHFQTWPEEEYELPIYSALDREKPEFWTYLLDELLLARLDVVLLHGRGCWDKKSGSVDSTQGTGSMCPRLLSRFVNAVDKAGVSDVIRVGMWDDTGGYRNARNMILGDNSIVFDLGDEDNWQFFWDYNIKIWFDTIPEKLWFRIDDRPLIASWNLHNEVFSNQEGNASRLLMWLRQQFQGAYGVEPYIILHDSWFRLDSTITTAHADGKHGWFAPPRKSYTFVAYNGNRYGVVVPGYRNAGTEPGCGVYVRELSRHMAAMVQNSIEELSSNKTIDMEFYTKMIEALYRRSQTDAFKPGCSVDCRELPRRGVKTLQEGLEKGTSANMIILEGWTDMIESAGFYRSQKWDFPTQFINVVRRYTDPEPETLLFQAEGADDFWDTTPENIGGEYSNRSLDVGALTDGTGWYVGWTEAGEWIEYKDVHLGCGLYRFSARVATTDSSEAQRIRLALGSLESVVVLPNSDYGLVHLGEVQLEAARSYDLRIVFETGGVNLDWFFSKRVSLLNCSTSY